MTQNNNNNNISSNSVKSGDDFRYLYITTQITHTHMNTRKESNKGGASWGSSTDHWRVFHSARATTGNHPPAALAVLSKSTHTRDWRFSRPEFTHTHISYSGVLQRCNNKRDPCRLWQPSAPPRGALVFMSAWVRIGEWAIRSECVRVGCSRHHSLGVMQNNAYIKQMNKHRKNTSKPAIYNVKTWTKH